MSPNPDASRTTSGHGRTVCELDRIMEPGHEEMGWLGQLLRVPLGYLGDAVKSAATFPDIHGVRYAVPGDRARLLADGTLELYGR